MVKQAWQDSKRNTRTANGAESLLNRRIVREAVVDKTDVMRSIYLESFFEFTKYFWDTVIPETPVWNWHIPFLCNEVQVIAERVLADLPKEYDFLCNIPPSSSKSTIISIMLPAWMWARKPSIKYIGVSFTYPLALDLSRKCRDVVISEKYQALFPHVQLREDQNTKGYFGTTAGGFRYCAAANGSVTGMHGSIIVIDDPLDPNQTLSKSELQATNTWITQTLPSRKTSSSITPTLLVMQRLHVEDPSALFMRKKRIRHVCLPAIVTDKVKPPELINKYVNGLMDPIRLSEAILEEKREDMESDFAYGAQYLQDPKAPGGGMFKTDKVQTGVPPNTFKAITRSWDKAATADGGDYTVGTLIAIDHDKKVWILDVVREKYDTGKREKLIKRVARKDEDDYGDVPITLEQEPGSGGKDSAVETVRNLQGFTVNVIKVGGTKTSAGKVSGDKVQRAMPLSSQMNNGNVYVPEGAEWFKVWKDEFAYFPATKYDDQVDSASTGYNAIAKKRKRAGASAV